MFYVVCSILQSLLMLFPLIGFKGYFLRGFDWIQLKLMGKKWG